MPPPVFGAAFSFVLQANPPRPAFRSRPEGAEYTGRGSLPCAGRVAEVSRGSGYEYFCTQNSSLCTFFVHGFRFLRERVYLRCTKIVRLKCWRGFNMLCSSCFLSWQEVWTALRFSPVGRFRSPTRFASPVSGRRFRHTIVSRRQSSPATLRSKIPSNPPPRRRSSACAMIPGPWRRPAGCRAVRLIRAASTCIPSRSIIMSFRWGVS